MVNGRTPFADIPNLVQKLQCIVNQRYEIKFPPIKNPLLLDIMQKILRRVASERPTIPQLLDHQFLRPEKMMLPSSK